MKIAPLLVASASALETSTSASDLLAAVGHRNVSKMEALVQGLVEESINEPGWKFDKDIQDALDAIRTMFVQSIQAALMDAHVVDQEAHNCAIMECFQSCTDDYEKNWQSCENQVEHCHELRDAHKSCRTNVYNKYKDMANKCGALHCFEPPTIKCPTEKCLCKDLLSCTRAMTDSYGGTTCTATDGNCLSDPKDGYGAWLQSTIDIYNSAYVEWQRLHTECTDSYRQFLFMDVECDAVQKTFESCMCTKSVTEERICSTDFAQCNEGCRALYDDSVPKLQCQEKDRKIDWSATKKIECYLDVLLHDYTEKELLDECGSKDCINIVREKKYKDCEKVCPKVDHDGEWGTPTCGDDGSVSVDAHPMRKEHDQYHLGDKSYKCDKNGPEVHTNHRGKVDRVKEHRCTEHLDIDYQIPRWQPCKPPKGKVCDAAFHCRYYAEFDSIKKIGCISDCCPENGGGCHTDVWLTSCSNAGGDYGAGWIPATQTIEFGEHTEAWAYNRCECQECNAALPAYPEPPKGQGKCTGVHTPGFGSKYAAYSQ